MVECMALSSPLKTIKRPKYAVNIIAYWQLLQGTDVSSLLYMVVSQDSHTCQL